ncbi:MAG: hypothetical protein RJA98_1259 [Pseudomonadota bacterium]|jgi:hypothetical protein
MTVPATANTAVPLPVAAMQSAFDAWRRDATPAHANALAAQWRHAARAAALPARYLEVLQRLLDPLESAALFTEESCSFSQADLASALTQWFDKAQALPPSA